MVREPRSAVIADPTAAAINMAATREAACRTTTKPLAAPDREVAPTCPARTENWMESVTPRGSATRMVGSTAVPAMNAPCRTNSCHWKRPVNRSTKNHCRVRAPSTNCSPTVAIEALGCRST